MVEVKIPWKNQSNTMWNETCAKVIEQFGLPGDRYTTEVTSDWMSFYFKDEKEGLMCMMLVSHEI